MEKIKKFISKNLVVIIATILAVITIFFVPISKEYLSYFDVKTLMTLFLMMLVIGALKNMKVFVFLATTIIEKLKNTRRIVFALVFITFFASMFLANDMALLTFLPLTLLVFKVSNKEKYIPLTIIMQNIAANFGGMLLPFGNPQSLYLYNYFNIGTLEFIKIMAVPFLVSLFLIFGVCMFTKKESVTVEKLSENKIKKVNLIFYLMFFLAVILSVFGVVNYLIVGGIVVIATLFLDRKAFLKVDYSLLITFFMFFIFASNMSRIEVVSSFMKILTEKNTLLTGVISCQLFSNVPSAIFLSKFTNNFRELLLAVNIGGAGTLIASLASLISFRIFSSEYPAKKWSYLLKFSLYNFTFLIILTLICSL